MDGQFFVDLAWLLNNGYAVSQRDPHVVSAFSEDLAQRISRDDSAFMVYAPNGGCEGFLATCDDLRTLICGARAQLDQAH
jgi:hypothetical protein